MNFWSYGVGKLRCSESDEERKMQPLRKTSACQRGYDYLKPCKSFILFQKVYKGRIYNFINIIIIIMLQKLTMFYVTWELDHQILDENTSKSSFYNPIVFLSHFADPLIAIG